MKIQDQGVSLPPYSTRIHRWFARYLRGYFGRSFTGVRVSRDGLPPAASEGPLVFFSNHPSWWDPVFFMLLGWRFYPGMEGYGPMEAAALEKYGFFRRLGVFGVETGTLEGARQFLETATAVVERDNAALWVTAEGEFSDPRNRPVRLASGLAHLAARMRRGAFVPLALEYPFWNERHPEALARFGTPIRVAEQVDRGAGAWRRLLEARLEETMDALAAEASRREPAHFETVLDGDAGVGGAYDFWRRWKARLRGRTFVAFHGDRS